jgi:hypothetical protein
LIDCSTEPPAVLSWVSTDCASVKVVPTVVPVVL